MSDPSSNTPTPKAIGSLAKKQSDVTRQGTQKLKFVPTLPQRRKKEEVKPEPPPVIVPTSQTERGRGRGRGRGDARGRGRGRGAAPPVVEMTASGPFAMGPALAGNNARRSAPRSNFVPNGPTGGPSNIGSNLSEGGPPSLRKNDLKSGPVKTEDDEVYSDPDEGVEIIDMENVRQMDWMAPESLRRERQTAKKMKVKKEEQVDDEIATGDVDTSNALNLSESEEEEELEDIIEDFATQTTMDADESMREERLYFFQFPEPFPKFTSKKETAMEVDQTPDIAGKKVSFALDAKSDMTPSSSRTPSIVPVEPTKTTTTPIDGVIGQLEVYRSGAVKIRLANGILLDVNAATQPSFLQQAAYLDKVEKQVTVLGEVNKQFVVSPNVDALLTALENDDDSAVLTVDGEEKLLKMDPPL